MNRETLVNRRSRLGRIRLVYDPVRQGGGPGCLQFVSGDGTREPLPLNVPLELGNGYLKKPEKLPDEANWYVQFSVSSAEPTELLVVIARYRSENPAVIRLIVMAPIVIKIGVGGYFSMRPIGKKKRDRKRKGRLPKYDRQEFRGEDFFEEDYGDVA